MSSIIYRPIWPANNPLQLIEECLNRSQKYCSAHIQSVKQFVLFKFWLKHSRFNAIWADLSRVPKLDCIDYLQCE